MSYDLRDSQYDLCSSTIPPTYYRVHLTNELKHLHMSYLACMIWGNFVYEIILELVLTGISYSFCFLLELFIVHFRLFLNILKRRWWLKNLTCLHLGCEQGRGSSGQKSKSKSLPQNFPLPAHPFWHSQSYLSQPT